MEKGVLGVKGQLVQSREGTGDTYNSRLPLETLSLCRCPSREAERYFSEKHFKEEIIPHSLSRQEGEPARQRPRKCMLFKEGLQQQQAVRDRKKAICCYDDLVL